MNKKIKWFVPGDLNGFFGLMFDNMTVLSFLAGILIFVFKYPSDIVFTKMWTHETPTQHENENMTQVAVHAMCWI